MAMLAPMELRTTSPKAPVSVARSQGSASGVTVTGIRRSASSGARTSASGEPSATSCSRAPTGTVADGCGESRQSTKNGHRPPKPCAPHEKQVPGEQLARRRRALGGHGAPRTITTLAEIVGKNNQLIRGHGKGHQRWCLQKPQRLAHGPGQGLRWVRRQDLEINSVTQTQQRVPGTQARM